MPISPIFSCRVTFVVLDYDNPDFNISNNCYFTLAMYEIHCTYKDITQKTMRDLLNNVFFKSI